MKLLDTVSLAVAVAFATPAALYGVETLARGDPVGWVFLGFAAAILGAEHYLTLPTDVPILAAQKAADAVVEEPDDENQ
ncbi:MAG: hypothetical protein ABEH83_08900 [Halobacterium sp.]